MKSELQFFHYGTHEVSDCGSVLEVELSSRNLNWHGMILEKGSSPHFFPTDVYTPYFYFAMALDNDLHWKAATEERFAELKTTPGDIWINPPRTPFTHEITEPCYFIILAIQETTFLNSCGFPLKGYPLQFINNYNVTDDTIRSLIELFFIEVQSKGRNGSVFVNHLLSSLVTHYIKNYSNYEDLRNTRTLPSKLDQSQLAVVDRYMEKNLDKAVTVEDLADLLGCSKFYFLREFRKLTDITPYQYLIGKRLEKASSLLEDETQTLARIGLDLGFNDQAHFTRAFKTHFGMTPGQFRKSRVTG